MKWLCMRIAFAYDVCDDISFPDLESINISLPLNEYGDVFWLYVCVRASVEPHANHNVLNISRHVLLMLMYNIFRINDIKSLSFSHFPLQILRTAIQKTRDKKSSRKQIFSTHSDTISNHVADFSITTACADDAVNNEWGRQRGVCPYRTASRVAHQPRLHGRDANAGANMSTSQWNITVRLHGKEEWPGCSLRTVRHQSYQSCHEHAEGQKPNYFLFKIATQ